MRRATRVATAVLSLVLALAAISLSGCRSRLVTRPTPTPVITRVPSKVPAISRTPTAAKVPAASVTPAAVKTQTPTVKAAGEATAASTGQACSVDADTVLAEGGIASAWIEWKTPCLSDADLVYVDNSSWELWVMDEHGGHKRCLTCYGQNALGVNFPLDTGNQGKDVRWKGDPEVHPSQPIIFFKAENENSKHKLSNTPSIGWDNDLWSLNVCTKRYSRLVQVADGQGLQATAFSNDGKWYVYPLRYDVGLPPLNFGLDRMVFNKLTVDANGDPSLKKMFEVEPNGKMYYEPNDIRANETGDYSLLYVAGTGNRLAPYGCNWREQAAECLNTNTQFLKESDQHEEFTMFSPSGRKIVWMAGPLEGLAYKADLYISAPDFTDAQRLTWYNDCKVWPKRCKPDGMQFSRLTWKRDGTAIFAGFWIHGGLLRPFQQNAVHRLDLVGDCNPR